jgi:glycosyltransferase involved in cell wall biosynthesis
MPGCRDVVVPGETGLLVPPGNVAALARAIATLAGDLEGRRRMGVAGRARVVDGFAEAAIAQQTLALLRAALAEREGGE